MAAAIQYTLYNIVESVFENMSWLYIINSLTIYIFCESLDVKSFKDIYSTSELYVILNFDNCNPLNKWMSSLLNIYIKNMDSLLSERPHD